MRQLWLLASVFCVNMQSFGAIVTYSGTASIEVVNGTIPGLNTGDIISFTFSWDTERSSLGSILNTGGGIQSDGSIFFDLGAGRTISSSGQVTQGWCCEGTAYIVRDLTAPGFTGALPAPTSIGVSLFGGGAAFSMFSAPTRLNPETTASLTVWFSEDFSGPLIRGRSVGELALVQPSAIPEPAGWTLCLMGIAAAWTRRLGSRQ